jgi:hypothetical protein
VTERRYTQVAGDDAGAWPMVSGPTFDQIASHPSAQLRETVVDLSDEDSQFWRHVRALARYTPPTPPAPLGRVPNEVEFARDRVCGDCGCQRLVEVNPSVFECWACGQLPQTPDESGQGTRPDLLKLVGLARIGQSYPGEDVPSDEALAALGCATFVAAGCDPRQPNSFPFAHVDWLSVRLAAYRRWPSERSWRSMRHHQAARERDELEREAAALDRHVAGEPEPVTHQWARRAIGANVFAVREPVP